MTSRGTDVQTARQQFESLVRNITEDISGQPVNEYLQGYLDQTYPADGQTFRQLADACRTGIAEGWLCNREQAGIRFGRIIKPGAGSHGFSVDVVDMENIVGPHHRHPNGEIDMVIPESTDALFDGHGAGWVVYGPGSDHRPAVSGGRAIILYLLPDGVIEFTGT